MLTENDEQAAGRDPHAGDKRKKNSNIEYSASKMVAKISISPASSPKLPPISPAASTQSEEEGNDSGNDTKEESYANLLDIVDNINAVQASLLTKCDSVGTSISALRDMLQRNLELQEEEDQKLISRQRARGSNGIWADELTEHAVSLSHSKEVQAHLEQLRKTMQK